jgi:hypothetical protein
MRAHKARRNTGNAMRATTLARLVTTPVMDKPDQSRANRGPEW